MTTLRTLLALAIVAILSVPAAVAAQDTNEAIAEPGAARTIADTRLAELEALVPEDLAGLPLRANMQAAPGELLASRMDADERAVLEAMLEANGKSIADYAAANVTLRMDDGAVIVVQPHRVTGVDAAATLDAWIEILRLNAERPQIDTTLIADHDVARISDAARPDFPVLHVFAVDDVVWMVVAQDEAVVEEAVRTFSDSSSDGEVAE